ncbi:inactive serine protease scarface-like [Culicoides brevitarsis]|uniref:inactive serine protease scarface-like n=1 Tax=Culicoides brevitarsis TaxID=469753 RepID=UPI00307B203F
MFRLAVIAVCCVFGIANAQDPFGVFTFKCSTAMVCVDKPSCDFNGVLSKTTVSLTEDEELFRMPLLPCKKPEGGRGVCCRDPDFVDDWPTDINYDEKGQYQAPPKAGSGCPQRNRTAMPDKDYRPYDEADFDAGAGEFPWQGAVLSSSGKLLCTCFFTEQNTCTTTASCVAGLKLEDIKVGVGMYDIAAPLKVQEAPGVDKKAQISPVKAIAVDPEYDAATKKRDIAVLHMEKEVEYNYYTLPICLDRPKAIPFFKYDDCVVTGWGKSDNTYHWADVLLLTEKECEELVPGFDRKRESCGKVNSDKNVCQLFDFGSGFQCRKIGQRNKPADDTYWLKGVYSAVNVCDPESQIITYSRIEFTQWFDDALRNPEKYSP